MSESDDILNRIAEARADLTQLVGGSRVPWAKRSAFGALDAAHAEIVRQRTECAPSDDEREALVHIIDSEVATYSPVTAADRHDLHESLTLAGGSDMAERVADKVQRAGFHRSPVTPPADDVREALGLTIEEAVNVGPVEGVSFAGRIADAVLTQFDVRPHGQSAEELIECPHWSPGSITLRKGCTACEAVYEPSDSPHGQSTEPSDAEVEAALIEYLDGAQEVDWQRSAMSAALSAAARVRSEAVRKTDGTHS